MCNGKPRARVTAWQGFCLTDSVRCFLGLAKKVVFPIWRKNVHIYGHYQVTEWHVLPRIAILVRPGSHIVIKVNPSSILGPCGQIQPSSKKQEEFISQCRVTYDCKEHQQNMQEDNACDRDYNVPCPLGWTLEEHPSGAFCQADQSYNGPCPWRFSFTRYTEKMKKSFSTVCKVWWNFTS